MPKVSLLNDPLLSGARLARFAVALLLIAFALPFIPAAEAQTGWTITTVAGTGEFGFGGDGGSAPAARLASPSGVAVDGAGNLYIADTQNHRIRKVDSTGTITTVAGTGESGVGGGGFSGDGGPAIAARLDSPEGVAVDGAGNLYISDRENDRIRKVDSTGTITTVAGTGGFGSGVDGDGGPASEARLYGPDGVAVDGAGNLYISERRNHRIRKVDSTGMITTVAGTGEDGFSGDGGPATAARLSYPEGVAVDGAGNLYISGNHRIRKVDSTGTITTVAGTGRSGFGGDGGPAVQAQLHEPLGVAVDGAGNLYIADVINHRIRKVDSTGTITTIAGTGLIGVFGGGFSGDGGPASEARLRLPFDVAVDGAGNLYIAGNHRIRKLTPMTGPVTPVPVIPGGSESFSITTIAGTGQYGFSGDGGPATAARLDSPEGVAVDGAGNLYIADRNNRILKVDSTGTITTVAGTGERGFSGDGGPATAARLNNPRGVAVDGAGNLYIADRWNHLIRKVDSTGTITTVAGTGRFGFSGDGGPAVEAQFNSPEGVAVDGAGNLYIAEDSNNRIRRVDSTGTITTIAGTGEFGFSGDGGPAVEARMIHPEGVAVDGAGNLYIADTFGQRIRKVDSAGTITTIAGTGARSFGGDGGPATAARLNNPKGVAVDGAGNLYIADRYNHRIRKVDSTGTITTIAGTGGIGFSGDGGPAVEARINSPEGVAVDGAGNVYIADRYNHRIRKVDSTGTITTIAGTGGIGFSGDGGPAVEAELSGPLGVAVDGASNLYIADRENHRIRKVDSTGTITTIAGTGEFGFSGDGGPATAARLNNPRGMAVDGAGNLYIADLNNWRIRKVDSTGTITTIAGTRGRGFSGDGGPAVEAELYNPEGVAVDGAGNLYIADTWNHRIRKVDSTGTITTIAGTGEFGFSGDGGPAVEAELYYPRGMALDGAGNLYIADVGNGRIRRVDSSGAITTIAGSGGGGFSGDGGPAVEAELRNPWGVAVGGEGNLYIADLGNHRIRKVDSAGTITTVAGTGVPGFSGDGGPAPAARLAGPIGVAVDGAGNLYIADSGNHRIRKLTPMTGPTTPVPVIPGGSEWFSISATTPYSLTVEWKEPENTGSAITDYDVRYREVGSGGDFIDARHEGTARTATLTGLSPGTAYEVQVRATNATGTGPWSQLGEVRTNPLQTGDHIYYFPHLAVGASWQTTITYINYSTQEVSCQTDFLSDQGSPLLVSFADRGTVVSRSDVLPPGGSVHQETNVGLTLAPGWARTTCSGPVTASLLFRQYNSAGVPVAEAGVNATRVAATRFVTFAEQGVGKAGTGVAYANPSATAALVTFTAKDAEGQVLARANRKLLAGGHDAQNMVSLFGLPSFSGSLEITSTEPIVSLSLNFEAAPVFSSLPPGEVDAAAQGTTTYYFPHLAVGASWQTTITYINYSPQQVSCTTDFISDHGSPLLVSFADRGTLVSRTDVLPAGWSVHQETNVGLTLAPGWARATCSGPVKASLLFRQRNGAGVPVAEAGVNATRVAATRFVTFAEQGEGKAGTGVAYANPSATAAHVTFTARDTEGQVLASVVRTLLPGGHDAQNMASLFGLPSFSGSLEITSTEPIVSLSLNFEAAPVFSSLPPGETPSGGALAPTSQAAFDSLFVGKVLVFDVLTANISGAPEEFSISFLSAVRAHVAGYSYDWTYEYVSTGLNTGTGTARTTLSGGRGVVVIMQLTFTTTTTGTVMYSDNDGVRYTGNFRIIDP